MCPINDYSCIMNRVSEFLYKPIDVVEGLAVRKENFQEMMQDPMAKKMLKQIKFAYKCQIQEPLQIHRDQTACLFENRIDYVDISAFGAGYANEQKERLMKNSTDPKLEQTTEERMLSKIVGFKKRMADI